MMTKDENQVLVEVATDVKWLKKAIEENALANSGEHKEIINHLAILNGKVSKNTTRSVVNRYGVAINFSILIVIISIILHLIGVY